MSTRGTTLSGAEFQLKRTTTIDSAKTLTNADSGTIFTMSATEGKAITLPALTDGFYAKFITGSTFATTAWTIVAPSAVLRGGAIVNSTFVASAGTTTITFSASAEAIGNYVEITCDGTYFYVNGVGAGASSIAFS